MNAKISPSFWNRYVDDTFTMFHNQDSANEFLHYLNGCHSNIKFTIEFEQNNAIPFLDILITRNQNSISASAPILVARISSSFLMFSLDDCSPKGSSSPSL